MKTKRYYYLILLVLPLSVLIQLLCFSCNKKSEIAFFVNSSYEDCGTFMDKDTKNEFVFFAKRNFNPHLKIFDSQANFKDSVTLKKAEEIVGKITKVWMTAEDSIFVFSSNTQKYVVVDNRGDPIHTKEFVKSISDKNNNFYDFYPPFMQSMDMRYNSEVIYTTFWVGNIKYSPNENNKTLSLVMNHIRDGYLMYREQNYSSKSLPPTFGIRISDFVELRDLQESVFLPYYKTLILNDRYFLLTYYSRYIYELDANLDIIDRFKVVPDELSVVQPMPDVEDDTSLEKLDVQIENQSYVSNLLYVKDKNRFVVILKTGKSTKEDIFSYPFKVLIYNSSLDKLLKSYEFNSTAFIPGSSFVLLNKLYVEKKNESHNKRVYESIEVY